MLGSRRSALDGEVAGWTPGHMGPTERRLGGTWCGTTRTYTCFGPPGTSSRLGMATDVGNVSKYVHYVSTGGRKRSGEPGTIIIFEYTRACIISNTG